MRALPVSSSLMVIAVSVNLLACAREARPVHYGYVAEPSLPPRPAFDPDASDAAPQRPNGSSIELHGPLSGAPAVRAQVYSVQQSARAVSGSAHNFLYGTPGVRATSTSTPSVNDTSDPSHGTKIEREAQLALGVTNVPNAAASILTLVRDRKGFVAKDERSSGGTPTAEMLVRVPVADFDAFLADVEKLGEVKLRRVRALDATLEHKDIEVLVANLEAAQTRYRDLLQHATDPAQILAIERELERVRADLERIKARLDYLRDRVAFATVAVSLVAPTPETGIDGGYRAHIATGFRALTLLDVRQGGVDAYTGAGLSLRFPRSTGDAGRGFVLDIDVMHACCNSTPDRSQWAYDVLTGFDLYSESLENGGRRWLNPYLGVRAGVAQTRDRIDFAAAAVIGIEIVKTRVLVVDLQTRVIALVGNPDGPHGALQPSLGFDLGF